MDYNRIIEINQKINPYDFHTQTRQCNLVGGTGLIVQIILGLLSFTALIYKKIYERPQRPNKIWLLDSSKQILSALFLHLANMFFSIILTTTGHAQSSLPPHLLSNPSQYIYGSIIDSVNLSDLPNAFNDPCNYYFITVIIDTSIGVFLSCYILSKLDLLFKKKGWEQLRSGNYYKEAKIHKRWKLIDQEQNQMYVPIEDTNFIEINYLAWLTQLAIWLTINFTTKILLFGIQAVFKIPLAFCSYYMLFWLNSLPFLKLIFVMIFIPTVMNAIQLWIQDNELKKKCYSADLDEIEEEEEESYDNIVKKKNQNGEEQPSEDMYSTKAKDYKERSCSPFYVSGLQDKDQPQSQTMYGDKGSQLNIFSYTKNPNKKSLKDNQTNIESINEFPSNLQGVQKNDNQYQNSQEVNSQMNKGFMQSSINTPVNSELLDALSNANQPNQYNQNNKQNKFSQFKDAIDCDHSYSGDSISKDFSSNNLKNIQKNSKSQSENISNLSPLSTQINICQFTSNRL